MVGVKEGVAELSGLIAMGDWKAAAQRAERIRDSYIMKQKLTPGELEDLERALPADFVEKDSQFHRHADGLAHAALEHNYELEVFYFSKMIEGCGACHARYATDVLKGYKPAGAHRSCALKSRYGRQDTVDGSLTETVGGWQSYWPKTVPLLFPIPRNNIWLGRNQWFEK